MSTHKTSSMIFTKDEEVAASGSWHQLTKMRNRQKKNFGKPYETYTQEAATTEDDNESLKHLEEKIRAEKVKQQHPHHTKPLSQEENKNDFDEFNDNATPEELNRSLRYRTGDEE